MGRPDRSGQRHRTTGRQPVLLRMLLAAVMVVLMIAAGPAPGSAQESNPFGTPAYELQPREGQARPSRPHRQHPRPSVTREKAAIRDERRAAETTPRPTVEVVIERLSIDALIARLREPALRFVDAKGALFDPDAGRHGSTLDARPTVSEPTIVETLQGVSLEDEHARALWTLFSRPPREEFLTLAVLESLLRATKTLGAGEFMWDALAGAASASEQDGGNKRSLLRLMERNRKALVPLLAAVSAPQNADDDIMKVVLSSRIFGATQDESIVSIAGHKPGTVARRIERERELGKPAWWEYIAFMEMVRWRNARLLASGAKAPATLADFDAISESFITIFNCMHGLETWYREQLVQGLGPSDLFNVVVSGEQELYRLGTSGYRQYLHPTILRGIKESKSFEAFLQRSALHRLGPAAVEANGRRGLVFLRIASSFGLLESVLETVRDRDGFIADAIAALGDPLALEGSGAVVMDILTTRPSSPSVAAFQKALLDRLYDRYRSSEAGSRQMVYGSILGTYQAVSGDRRDAEIDRVFVVDRSMFHLSFDRLFGRDARGKPIHRMFMRFDEDVDARNTHASFRRLMVDRGASVRSDKHHDVYVLARRGRTIEIYANKPTAQGVRDGISDIARDLEGKRVETVIGRGHTGIISPLQRDARRILGPRVKDVASVIVGTCGGNASVRQLIDTFGYVPFVASKSTGRALLNNAIIEAYVDALLAAAPSEGLSLQPVLDRAMAPFISRRDGDLREDAKLYLVNISTVLSAYMFDKHVTQVKLSDRSPE